MEDVVIEHDDGKVEKIVKVPSSIPGDTRKMWMTVDSALDYERLVRSAGFIEYADIIAKAIQERELV